MSQHQKNRNQGLDLLRIICMLMVICLHYLGTDNVIGEADLYSANWFVSHTFFALSMVAINCFVLLSGYFLCESTIRLGRWLSIWIQVVIYSLGIYLVLCTTGVVPFDWTEAVKSMMVVTLKRYWFVTAYLILYAVAPFLNILISAMDRRSHFLLCATMLFIYSFLHNLVYICDFGGLAGGTNLIWFGTLYMVAAYIRKYVPCGCTTRRGLCIYSVCVLSLVLWRTLTLWLTPKFFGTPILTGLLQTRSSVPVTMGSIALFLAMKSLIIRGKLLAKIITFFAPLSFAVYLIHEQPELRPILWDTLHPSTYADSPWMLLHMVVSIFGIFVICCLIEYGRLWLFRILRIDRFIKSISEKVKSITDSILNKMGI